MYRFIFISLFVIFSLEISAQGINLDREMDPSALVYGCINPVSGSYIDSEVDIVVKGPETLTFSRFYNSAMTRPTGYLGVGTSLNFPIDVVDFTKDKNIESVFIEEGGGSFLRYCSAGGNDFYPDVNLPGNGLTNCGSGAPSARTNIKLMRLFALRQSTKEKTWPWRLELPNGEKRFYRDDSHLDYEIKSNGNRINYVYEKRPEVVRLTRIYTTDKSGSIVFNWMDFFYNDDKDTMTIKASNGKTAFFQKKCETVTIALDKKTTQKRLVNLLYYAESSSHSQNSYAYHKSARDRITSEVGRIAKQNGRFLEISYQGHKVSELKTPLGVVYRFKYENLKTSAIDANKNRCDYLYSKENWLTGIVSFRNKGGNYTPYSEQKFFYEKIDNSLVQGHPPKDKGGFLVTKGLADSSGKLIKASHFTYDDRGNIVKETTLGNLSGKIQCPSIDLDANHNPVSGDFESHFVEKTYSNDGFNLLLSEQEEGGLYSEYRYLPDTDLLLSKLIYDNGKICIRHFNEYDHLNILTKKIVDDGCRPGKDDLTGVSERKIISILPRYTSPGIGQPQTMQESYLDSFGKEVPLKRIDYTYGTNDLVIQEDIYDENSKFCYSIKRKYDAHDNLIEETDPLDRTTLFAYDINDNLLCEERLGSNCRVNYTYDLCNRLIKKEEVHSDQILETKFEYDLLGHKTCETDPYGSVTNFFYDELGREIQVVFSDGTREIKDYNIAGDLISITDKEGNTTFKECNAYGKPTKIIFPDGSVEQFSYEKNGRLLEKIERDRKRVINTYDAFGRVILEECFGPSNSLIYRQSFEYNAFHLIRSYDMMGICTEYKYDGAGRKCEEVIGLKKKSFVYDSLGRLCALKKWVSEVDYCATLHNYDRLNRIIEERLEDASGKLYRRTNFVYDDRSNRIETSSAPDKISRRIYNSRNEIIAEIDPYGNRVEFSYDKLKKITTDPFGNYTIEIFTPQFQRASIEKKDCKGNRISFVEFSYDKMGRESLQKRAVIEGGQWKRDFSIASSFDCMGRLVSLKEMDKETTYTYDDCGRILSIIKPDGNILRHGYDTYGHLNSLKSSDGSIDYFYLWDLNHNLLEVNDHGEKTSVYTYDDYGSLIRERLANGFIINYDYDISDRLKEVIFPDKSSVTYLYNAFDLVRVERKSCDGELLYGHDYLEHDEEGNPTREKLACDAGIRTYDYDFLGRLRHSMHDFFEETIPQNSFDALGNLHRYNLRDPVGSLEMTFDYDSSSQLSREDRHTYAHDSLYNCVKKDDAVYKINTNNQIVETTHDNFTYDKNGNIVAISSTKYAYDALNRLVEVESDEQLVHYTYDSFGRRMSKSVNGEKTTFLYQKQCEIGSYDDSGNLTLRILGKGRAAEVKASIAIEIADSIYIPIHDYRGNICLLLDSTGNIVETLRYTAFGTVTIFGEDLTPWQYASKRFDKETGFTFFSNRYYLPELGRWLTPDPLGFYDSPNLYAYVNNNPLLFCDPYGLFSMPFMNRHPLLPKMRPNRYFPDPRAYVPECSPLSSFHEKLFKNPNLMRYFNIPKEFQHTQTKPKCQGSKMFDLSREEPEGFGAGLCNGVNNSEGESLESAVYLSDLMGGVNTHNVYNATYGILLDIGRCILEFLHIGTDPVELLHNTWDNYFDENPDGYFYQVCHSEGALITRNALLTYSEERRKRIYVCAIAPAAYIPKDICLEVWHYRAEGWRDPIPLIDQVGRLQCLKNTIVLPSHPDAPQHDHSFKSPTYRKVIVDDFNYFKGRYLR